MATQSNAKIGRSAIIALAVFGGLLAITLVDYGANQNVSVGIRSLTLPKLDKDNVTSIELGGKFKASLSKDGGTWKVADPAAADKKFTADADAVKRALDALDSLQSGAFVTGRKEKHEELEINEEKGTLATFKTSDGKTLAVAFGRFAQGGGNYVRLQGSDEVFVGKGTLAGTLKKDAEGWRNKEMVSVSADEMTALVVKPQGAAAYTLNATTAAPPPQDPESAAPPPSAQTAWKLAADTVIPEGMRLDEAALGRIARSFASLRASGFADDNAAPGVTGLDASAAKISATTSKGPIEVSFGKSVDGKTYAQVSGNPQVFWVNDYSVKNLVKPLTGHRDLALFVGADPTQIVSVAFKGKGIDARVQKDDTGAWSYSGKPAAPAFDGASVAGKLAGLARMKAARFVGSKLPAAKLKKNALSITLTLADGSTQKVTLGGAAAPTADGNNKNQVVAKGADGLGYAIAKFQKERYGKLGELFKAPAPPPGGMGGMGGMGGIPGLENLPPEIRKQLEAQMKSGQFPPPGR